MQRQSVVAGFPPDTPMTGTTAASVRSGSINGGADGMLGPMTSLSMSDQQQQQQGFVDMTMTPQPEPQFFNGFMDMADWRLPMEYQPELWQFDSVLDNNRYNQN